jgi:putative DeoR family transcriptional regulator (stage III sporulation protein D)
MLDRALSAQVRQLLDQNKAERHLRGGLATKKKYEYRQKLSAAANGSK